MNAQPPVGPGTRSVLNPHLLALDARGKLTNAVPIRLVGIRGISLGVPPDLQILSESERNAYRSAQNAADGVCQHTGDFLPAKARAAHRVMAELRKRAGVLSRARGRHEDSDDDLRVELVEVKAPAGTRQRAIALLRALALGWAGRKP